MRNFFIQDNAKKCATLFIMLCCISLAITQEMDDNVPVGWATYPHSEYEEKNTTGGHDGEVVIAKTNEELKKYLETSDDPLVVIAEGSFSGDYLIRRNKSIIGGGSGAKLKGMFILNDNNILRNFEISGGHDAVKIDGEAHHLDKGIIEPVTHIWIDHLKVHACNDGLIDITNESDLVTVSWTEFSNHHKTMLINNGHENENEVDKLNVTLHHLYWNGSRTRNPRCGYGDVHVLNCYYVNNGYGIHLHWECRMHIERNYFKGTRDKISQHKPGRGRTGKLKMDWDGYAVLVDNVPKSGFGVKSSTDPAKIFDVDKVYMYDWIVDDVNSVPEIVPKGAGPGPQWSKLTPIPTPGQGCVVVSIKPVLKWTKVGSLEKDKVYFGTTKNPPEVATVTNNAYMPGTLEDNKVYYWKINDGKLWTFRTDASVAIENSNIKSSKSPKKPNPHAILKTGTSKHPNLFISIKNGDKNKIYDFKGRGYPSPSDSLVKPNRNQPVN